MIRIMAALLAAATVLGVPSDESNWLSQNDLTVQTGKAEKNPAVGAAFTAVDQNKCVNRSEALNSLALATKDLETGPLYRWAVGQALSYAMAQEGRDFCDAPRKGSSTALYN
jgi:hypothetical protein